MKGVGPSVMVVSVGGIWCVMAGTISTFYYQLYRHSETKVDYLERRVEWLETYKPRYVVPVRARAAVSTTDQTESDPLFVRTGPGKGARYQVFQPTATTGPVVGPALRLPAGSTHRQEFDFVAEGSF